MSVANVFLATLFLVLPGFKECLNEENVCQENLELAANVCRNMFSVFCFFFFFFFFF